MIEAYVSTLSDGVFDILDLGTDAKDIIMKYTQKDLQDISKVFAPYSLDFTLPPSDNNKKRLDWFGYNDASVTHESKDFKFPIKIYVNSILHLQGFLKCKGLTVKGEFNTQFATSMLSLKDRIGNDLISQLPIEKIVSWKGADIVNYMHGIQSSSINDIAVRFFVPFSSNSRAWIYDTSLPTNTSNNIAFIDTSYNNETAINTLEVSPAISYLTILNAIIKFYQLDIFISPAITPALNDLYLSCTGVKSGDNSFHVLKITQPYEIVSPGTFLARLNYNPHTYHTSGGTFANPFLRIDQRPVSEVGDFKSKNKYCDVRITLNGVVTDENNNITFRLVRPSDNLVISNTITVKAKNGLASCSLKILDDTFISKGENVVSGWKSLYYNVEIKSDQQLSWSTCDKVVTYTADHQGSLPLFFGGTWHSLLNNNFAGLSQVFATLDLFKSLPNMKVADFLTNFFKMFNIAIYDNDPLNDRLQWLTPADVNTIDKEYSKRERDYTEFVIDKKPSKTKSDDYDSYTFKHATSNLIANTQYKDAFGVGFGDLYYPELAERAVKKTNKELKIETTLTVTGNVSIPGLPDAFTFYGFDASLKPVDESIIFFIGRTGSSPTLQFINPVAVQNILPNGTKDSIRLDYYIPVSSDRLINNVYQESLTWGGTTVADKSLFKMGYETFVQRLLDYKALEHKFKLQLPLSELYLTKQFQQITPYGWRLQNDIIIEENRYSIIDAEINVENGLTNLTLYNYTAQNNGLVIPPTKQYKINQYKNNQYR
jgi:hypothetical protein